MGDVRISAKSTLIALNRSIEVISGNLTGASIFGYKGVRLSFADTLVNVLRNGTAASGGSGGLNPIQVGTGGISVGSTTTDFSQGSIVQTKNAGDVALNGNAFFTTVDAAGRITYTRNGEFHFDDQGQLTTSEGRYVLGHFDDLREITQNDKLVDFDNSFDFRTENDALTAAQANGRIGITMNWGDNGAVNPGRGLNGLTSITAPGGTLYFQGLSTETGNSGNGGYFKDVQTGDTDTVKLYSYLDLPREDNLQDRVLSQSFIGAGALGNAAASNTTPFIGTILLGYISAPEPLNQDSVSVILELNNTNNSFANTSLDNAKLIAQAINDVADTTGIGASVIVNQNKLDQAAIVLSHVQRALSTTIVRLATETQNDVQTGNTNLYNTLNNTQAGVLENATDSRGNLFHRISLKSLIGRSPRFVPQAGDRFQFDSTGQLINTSRGQDENSAPPFATGIHIGITKFGNDDGLEKARGSSQFNYTEAAGDIVVGYAGLDKGKTIDIKRGIEVTGTSIIGTENSIIPTALEASNTSITEALPDLTIAQKSFTSNTKVVNVGNSIVDDLNGLIR